MKISVIFTVFLILKTILEADLKGIAMSNKLQNHTTVINDETSNENNTSDVLLNILWASYIPSTVYKKPEKATLQKAQSLFRSLLSKKEINQSETDEWKILGFTYQEIQDGSYIIGVLSQTSSGHGMYAVKLKNDNGEKFVDTSGYILQAPHVPSDLHTGSIIYSLFLEGHFSAAAWSTTHRKSVDLAREPESYYNTFTEAVASIYSTPTVLQLHGYDAIKHNLLCDVILSASSIQSHNKLFEKNAASITNEFSKHFTVYVFPKDVDILGGLKNINAKKFYEVNPQGNFMHVETSLKFRESLLNSRNTRSKFIKCFNTPI